jgi:DHA3 family macrolide efflux protein-like MFS transporter
MSFLKVLLHRHLALLWSGQVLSAIGDYFYQIAVIWIAVKVAGSAGSIVVAAQSGAALVFGLLGGVYADRWNRRTTMMMVDVVRAIAVGILPILALIGALQLWHLVLVAIVLGSLGSLFNPALQASLPALAGDERTLQATNGLMDITRRLARALGPSLAGVLVALMPLTQFFSLDAISFGISAGSIFLLGGRFAWRPERSAKRKKGIGGIISELGGAMRVVHSHAPIEWAILTGGIVSGAWSASFTIGTALLAAHLPGGNVGTYGLIVGAYGVGNVISNLVVGSITIRRRVMVMLMGRLIVGAGFLIMVSRPILAVVLFGSAFAALGGPVADIPFLMLVQTDLPSNQMGKVFSLDMTVEQAGGAIGLLLAIPLFHYVSTPIAITICALVIASTSVAGLIRFGFREPVIEAIQR